MEENVVEALVDECPILDSFGVEDLGRYMGVQLTCSIPD